MDSGEMSRRTLIVGAGAAAGLSLMPKFAFAKPNMSKLIKPQRLIPGDTVWIVAPSGASAGQENIDSGIAKIEGLGYKAKLGNNIAKRYGYLAGTDEERASDVNDALRCQESKGIFFLRGGYGAMRILPDLDYDAFRKYPKVASGFSDITALHMAFLTQSRVVTFHGPCAESSWSPFSKSTIGIITEAEAFGEVKHPTGDPLAMNRKTLVPGIAEGSIVAGNLSMIVSLLGTPYMPSLKDAILVLEDIGEDPYRVDRMLTQIWLSGEFKHAKGLIFGNFRERRPAGAPVPDTSDASTTFNIDQVFSDRAKKIGLPCYQGLSFGHIGLNHIIPQGIRAKINAEACRLDILESAVSDR